MASSHGQAINELRPGQSLRLVKIEYGGSLEARRPMSGNVMLYWRHTEGGKTERTPIGAYDSAAPPKALKPTARGFSIVAATEAARQLAKTNAEVPGGLRAERVRQAASAAAAQKAADARDRCTLKALCSEYCAWLKAQGKGSWHEAEIIFDNHLPAELAGTPAARVEKRQIVEAVRKLTEAGKLATARKLRSYLRAAFACAGKADSDAALPSAFIAFAVTNNPVESTAAIRGKADKNPLGLTDLRKYWQALKEEPGVAGAALRLQLVIGAQRVAQLARLHERDISEDRLQLWDPKGKRAEARAHLLPLTKAVRKELAQLSKTGYVLSTDGGKTPMHPTSLSAWAADVGRRAKIAGFQLKRVRSGVETALASAGVPLHVRGQLQSHGISGVQALHYDAHEYLPEKREALEVLYKVLDSAEPTNVAKIRRRRAS